MSSGEAFEVRQTLRRSGHGFEGFSRGFAGFLEGTKGNQQFVGEDRVRHTHTPL